MKVALVYDRINKFGGAERVILALHEIWPDAPVYTAVYDRKTAKWAEKFQIIPSFLNRIPLMRRNHELLAMLTPVAFESFNFDGYDLVISVTSAEAKYIITKPGTVHVCYCLTPTRYLWSGYAEYIRTKGAGLFHGFMPLVLKMLANRLRNWDLIGSQRPDRYLAISEMVGLRIKKYYGRKTDRVIYPPVDTRMFMGSGKYLSAEKSDYYLTVSRFVGYKRLDLIIDAFNELGWKLIIIGSGRDRKLLKSRSKPNILFVESYLTDRELVDYYKKCRGFVFAGREDFGLVSVEAQACGAPVFAYRDSGMAETVVEGVTGELFNEQSILSIKEVLINSKNKRYDPEQCRKNALKFDLAVFKKEFSAYIKSLELI
jgi:glycosyltransferase involved in cell wall biosynthesis